MSGTGGTGRAGGGGRASGGGGPGRASGGGGLRHVYSGKVRELYEMAGDRLDAGQRDTGERDTGRRGDLLLLVATDRVSAFDHVLEPEIPDKGAILTQLSLWWFERLADIVPNHLVDAPVPAGLAGRAMACRRLEMVPVECVARGYLAGSGVADYRRTGAVCGIPLPPGLTEGSRLPGPVFTPATKAPRGRHDENIPLTAVAGLVGGRVAAELERVTLAVYARGADLAAQRGIIVADTKIELGFDAGGVLRLADEVLTPDSSRLWPAEEWAPGGSQPSLDKQHIRDWLASPASGWDRGSDEPPPPLPASVVELTRNAYIAAYQKITGRRWR